jgi:hypothetical protein
MGGTARAIEIARAQSDQVAVASRALLFILCRLICP